MNFKFTKNNKIMKYTLIIIIVLQIVSCQKDNPKKTVSKKPVKQTKIISEDIKKIKTDKNFNASEYQYENISIKLPENFKRKESNLFFQENGTNLSIKKDYTNTSLDKYIKENYKKLKSEFSNTIKEEEEVNINNQLFKRVKYVIDRKKYLIQIESILIKKDNTIYIVNISGKKKHIDSLTQTINNIFSTITIEGN